MTSGTTLLLSVWICICLAKLIGTSIYPIHARNFARSSFRVASLLRASTRPLILIERAYDLRWKLSFRPL